IPYAYAKRGGFYFGNQAKFDDLTQAQNDCAKALSLEPGNYEATVLALNLLPYDFQGEELLAKREELLQAAIEANETKPKLYLEYARQKTIQQKRTEAKEVLRQGHEKNPSAYTLPVNLAELHLEDGERNEAVKVLGRLVNLKEQFEERTPGHPEVQIIEREIELLEIRLEMTDQKWRLAEERLVPLRTTWEEVDTRRAVVLDFLLVQCYEKLGQQDQQILSLERILRSDPNNLGALTQLFNLANNDGKYREALLYSPRIAELTRQRAPHLLAQVIRNWLDVQVKFARQQGGDEPDWNVVDNLLATVNHTQEISPISRYMIQVQGYYQTGRLSKAKEVLAAAKMAYPNEERLDQVSSALDDEGQLTLERLDNEIAKLEDAQKNSVKSRLQLAYFWFLRESLNTREQQQQVWKNIDTLSLNVESFTKDEKIELWEGLGELAVLAKNRVYAEKYWTLAIEENRENLTLQLNLFDLALSAKKEEKANAIAQTIKEIATEGSSEYQYTTALSKAVKIPALTDPAKQQEEIAEVQTILREIEALRPNWYKIYSLRADLNKIEGSTTDEIENWKKTLQYGPPSPNVAFQLMIKYEQLGEWDEIDALMKEYAGNPHPGMQRYKVLLAAKNNNKGEVIASAKDALLNNQGMTIENAIFYTMLLAQNDPDSLSLTLASSEELLRSYPQNIQVLSTRVQVLVIAKKEQEALEVIEQAKKTLPAEQQPVAVGLLYEQLGQSQLTEQHYLSNYQKLPHNMGLLHAIVNFYIQTKKTEQANHYLTLLLKLEPQNEQEKLILAAARRTKAQNILSSGLYPDYLKAVELYRQNETLLGGYSEIDQETRLHLGVTMRNDFKTHLAVLAELEALAEDEELTLGKRQIMATAYHRLGNKAKAKEMLREISSEVPGNIKFQEHFASILVEQEAYSDAYDVVNRSMPQSPMAVQLRFWNHLERGRTEEALDYLKRNFPLTLSKQESIRLKTAATMAFKAGDFALSEEYIRRYIRHYPSQTDLLLAYVDPDKKGDYLDEMKEHLQLLKQEKFSLEGQFLFGFAVFNHLQKLATVDDLLIQDLESIVQAMKEKSPESIEVLLYEADLAGVLGDSPRVINLCRKYIAEHKVDDANMAIIKNNLAYNLALTDKAEEARIYIDQAMQILGEIPQFLDTAALVEMHRNRPKEAIEIFTAIERYSVLTNSLCLHFAWAYHLDQQPEKAAEYLLKGKELGIQNLLLHPAEQKELEKLLKMVGN
ncbi:MAG: hypothetical protein MPJ24_07000, partial [Pirellulaceae bacterium]|nr:hypothetical protein [Pirellulaceae bacterium]